MAALSWKQPSLKLARRCALLAVAAWLAGCALPGPTPDVPPAQRALLAPGGTLRIAVYAGSPTSLVRKVPPAEMRGLSVDIGRELARRLGVAAEIVVFERVAQVVDALKAGQADFTITNASPARQRELDFTAAVVALETGYLVAAASPITSLAEVDRAGVRVGVSQGSTSQGVLGRELKQARLIAAPTVAAATELLRRGELDAFATNKAILFEMSDSLPGARVLDGRWGLEQLAIAVPKGRDAGAAYLQAFATDVIAQGLVQRAAARAGLRGLARPVTP